MQNDKVSAKRRRLNDFPELQVGFPERNDVSIPDEEIGRVDTDRTDLETPASPLTRSVGRGVEVGGTRVSRA